MTHLIEMWINSQNEVMYTHRLHILNISCISTMVQTLLTKVCVNISTAQECLNKVGLQTYDCFGQGKYEEWLHWRGCWIKYIIRFYNNWNMTVQIFKWNSYEVNPTKDYTLNHPLRICRAKTGHKMLRSKVRNVCQKYVWM